MRFAVINTVPPGFCRKMHILAPGGRIADLAELKREQLPQVGLSPTHMEVIQGFSEWHRRGISPCLGLLMWYLESVQLPSGAFLRTDDGPDPSVGVAIRYLQIAGQLGIHRSECESVERAAHWLENQIDDDGLIRMPITGIIDYGMLARSIRALHGVGVTESHALAVERGCRALASARIDDSSWPTYPDGEPSTGATSLAIMAVANCSEFFDFTVDTSWLIAARNPDGGWGESAGSPSKVDNTFWAYRACLNAGDPIDERISPELLSSKGADTYDTAMIERLRLLVGFELDDELTDLAMNALTDEADRYAETTLLGLAIADSLTAGNTGHDRSLDSQPLPVRTPDFIRREPPLYDQLAEVSQRPWWTRLVERAARVRVAESSIGWLVGLSAAIALIGEEFVSGLNALPVVPLVVILVLQICLALGWMAARQNQRRRFNGLPHFLIAGGLALLLVLLVKSPDDVTISPLPTAILAILFALIIEVISVATDKADLLNRLGDD